MDFPPSPPSQTKLSPLVHPSLLACNKGFVAQEVKNLEKSGANGLHIDIMDGHFVPNLTMGASILKSIWNITSLPLDVHLMVTLDVLKNPLIFTEFIQYSHWITLHWEVFQPLSNHQKLKEKSFENEGSLDLFKKITQPIKEAGKKVGLALKPATPLNAVPLKLWSDVDVILIMTVEPGFGGQKFLHSQIQKLKAAQELSLQFPHLLISVDGGINKETAPLVTPFAHILVAGSYIFKNPPYSKAIHGLTST
jgi:ribulose-phosphate 3-epimerase